MAGYEDLTREDLIAHIAELNREIVGLRQERDENAWVQDSLRERTHILDERIKELRCSYEAIRLLRAPYELKEKLAFFVRAIPHAWQYPRFTKVRIELSGLRAASPDYSDTPWSQEEPIRSNHHTVGSIKVCYLKEFPPAHEGPFLREERTLIKCLAECLGILYETNLVR